MICYTRILEAEWHYFVAEEALAGDEQSLLLISFIEFDLVVARKSIYKAQ